MVLNFGAAGRRVFCVWLCLFSYLKNCCAFDCLILVEVGHSGRKDSHAVQIHLELLQVIQVIHLRHEVLERIHLLLAAVSRRIQALQVDSLSVKWRARWEKTEREREKNTNKTKQKNKLKTEPFRFVIHTIDQRLLNQDRNWFAKFIY